MKSLILKLSFQWLIREIVQNILFKSYLYKLNMSIYWQSSAIQTVQETMKTFLIEYLENNTLYIDVEINY